LKFGLRQFHWGKAAIDFSLGVNNVFDQDYSLGNDLNAANNRYFNPAAKRNYSLGLGVKL
jgi:iron complex outermembrane receptor protein